MCRCQTKRTKLERVKLFRPPHRTAGFPNAEIVPEQQSRLGGIRGERNDVIVHGVPERNLGSTSVAWVCVCVFLGDNLKWKWSATCDISRTARYPWHSDAPSCDFRRLWVGVRATTARYLWVIVVSRISSLEKVVRFIWLRFVNRFVQRNSNILLEGVARY